MTFISLPIFIDAHFAIGSPRRRLRCFQCHIAIIDALAHFAAILSPSPPPFLRHIDGCRSLLPLILLMPLPLIADIAAAADFRFLSFRCHIFEIIYYFRHLPHVFFHAS
jgi:hypothetical protein